MASGGGGAVAAIRGLLARAYKGVLTVLPRPVQVLAMYPRFYLSHRYWPRIRRPRTFSEKIQHRKFFTDEALFAICADRIAVRDHVAARVGADYLIDLLAVFDRAGDIDLSGIDGEIAIKASHDSGTYILLEEGQTPDLAAIRTRMARALNRDYGAISGEYWYRPIPRRVTVERLLRDSAGRLPDDYKFHVFRKGAETRIIVQVCHSRHSDHINAFYTEDGNQLDMALLTPFRAIPFERPERYDEMLEISRRLAEDFTYVRVDLYDVDGRIYFGELTFAHLSGLDRVTPYDMDALLGSYWDITPESRIAG